MIMNEQLGKGRGVGGGKHSFICKYATASSLKAYGVALPALTFNCRKQK